MKYLKLPSLIKGWFNPEAHLPSLLRDFQQSGKAAVLSPLVEELNQPIFHYLLSLSDQELAKDCLQQTWLKVLQTRSGNNADKLNSFNDKAQIKAWLFTIARNTLIDEMRRNSRWQAEQWQDDKAHSGKTAEQTIIEQDRLTLLNSAIASLPILQREAFIFQQEGLSLSEISQVTNAEHETVKSRLRYARQTIAQTLRAEDE